MPLLWYWPRGLKAVGHLSHDTDGNDPTAGRGAAGCHQPLPCEITWCTLYPGGYPREFYRTLQEQDFEIALHYDAMTGGPQTSLVERKLPAAASLAAQGGRAVAHHFEQEPLHALGEPTGLLAVVRRGRDQLRPDARPEQEGHDRVSAGRFAAVFPARTTNAMRRDS